MVVRELLTRLGFEVDNKGVEKYDEALNGLVEKAKHLAEAWGLMELGKKLIEAGSDAEQMQIQFEGLTGSAEKAQGFIEQLGDFSAKNPMFKKDELAEYAKQMLSLGYSTQEVMPLMNQMGNVAAVLGKDKMGLMIGSLERVRATGKVSFREVRSLMMAGIPIIDQMAKQYGVTKVQMQKMLQTGRVDVAQYYKALQGLTSGNGIFAGGLQRQSLTFKSTWEGIINKFHEFAESIGTKVLPFITKLAGGFSNFFTKNQGLFEDVIIKPAQTVAYVLGFIVGTFDKLTKGIGGLNGVMNNLKGLWDAFWDGIQVILKNKTFMNLATIIGGIAAAWGLWNLAMEASPIVQIATALAAIVAAIGWLSDHPNALKDALKSPKEALASPEAVKQAKDAARFSPALAGALGIAPTLSAEQNYRLGGTPSSGLPGKDPAARGHATGTTYVHQTGPAWLHAGEAVVPRGQLGNFLANASRIGAGLVSKTLSVKASINVSVPEGTPNNQAAFLKTVAEKAVNESWQRILRQTNAELIPALRG